MRHGKCIDIADSQLGVLEHVLSHRQQRAAVGQAAALAVLTYEMPVAAERNRRGFCR